MWLMVWDVSFQELASKEINIKTVNNNMYLLKSAIFSDQNSDEDSERILCQLQLTMSQHYGNTGCGVFKRGVQN